MSQIRDWKNTFLYLKIKVSAMVTQVDAVEDTTVGKVMIVER